MSKCKFKRNDMGVEESRKYEQLIADNEKFKADIEYIAMMADVELEDTTEGTEEEEV